MFDLITIILAYLLGSVASAIVVCRLMGLGDPREGGSGNPGATNVLRLHGKKVAAITLAGDVLKGSIAVLLAHLLVSDSLYLALSAFAVFLGHLYPIFFRFKGGKGVATYIGVVIAVDWKLGLAFGLTWLTCAVIFRYSSLSSLTAALLTPLYAWVLFPDIYMVIATLCMTGLLFWRHQSNIHKLLAGEESRIGDKA